MQLLQGSSVDAVLLILLVLLALREQRFPQVLDRLLLMRNLLVEASYLLFEVVYILNAFLVVVAPILLLRLELVRQLLLVFQLIDRELVLSPQLLHLAHQHFDAFHAFLMKAQPL